MESSTDLLYENWSLATNRDSSISRSGQLDLTAIQKASEEIGVIYTNFPENPEPEFEGETDFPLSYHTLNSKERLLLLFAENFRRQHFVQYKKRKPPILAIANECGVQKFVSTTLRPTAFLFPELIGSWQENAKFVADFIFYEPLPNPIVMVSSCTVFLSIQLSSRRIRPQ